MLAFPSRKSICCYLLCILQVISKEANFVKVRLDDSTDPKPAGTGHTVLFCTVRALLKKIKQTVLVGDQVEVQAIDWTDKQGQCSRMKLQPNMSLTVSLHAQRLCQMLPEPPRVTQCYVGCALHAMIFLQRNPFSHVIPASS